MRSIKMPAGSAQYPYARHARTRLAERAQRGTAPTEPRRSAARRRDPSGVISEAPAPRATSKIAAPAERRRSGAPRGRLAAEVRSAQAAARVGIVHAAQLPAGTGLILISTGMAAL
jgi:hypothetical protein